MLLSTQRWWSRQERLTSTFAKLRQGIIMTAQQMHVAQKGSHIGLFFSQVVVSHCIDSSKVGY
jgi:hypothetical protein